MKKLNDVVNEWLTTLSDYYVRFGKVGGEIGIVFAYNNDAHEPEDVERLCNAVNLEYDGSEYEYINDPVYFWNIEHNTSYWVDLSDVSQIVGR